MSSRTTKILSAAGAAVLLTAGGLGAAQLDKAVTLTVDGESSAHHVFGSTVGDLLDSKGINVGPDDVVVPAVSEPIEDGDEVTVNYVRTLTVTLDGKPQQIKTTETTVDGVLLALGVRDPDARVSASRSTTIGREGLALTVTTPKSVNVLDGGKASKHTLVATTVGEALAQLQAKPDADDKVIPAVATPLTDGMKIAIQRVSTKDSASTKAVPFTTVNKKTNTLYTGSTKVETAGKRGTKSVTVRQTIVDGKVTKTQKVSEKVTKAPVAKVVLVGTKQRPAPAASTSSSSSSSSTRSTGSTGSTKGINLARAGMWDRVAACESTGRWNINTGNGYYGGLQFAYGTWLAYGGADFASRADLATRAQQITVANRVYADNGLAQWGCKA